MDIIASDPTLGSEQIAERGATQVTLAELLARSDFVSVHCPLTKETIDLFDEAAFARMKPSAYFINTSRGRIHNQRTLLDALRAGRIAGAGLDVFDVEPLPSDHPLLQMDNVVATPHIAGGTHESLENMARACAEQWIEILRGHVPPRLINPQARQQYLERSERVLASRPGAGVSAAP